MALLDHSFYTDAHGGAYELSLSAWGEGVLREEELLNMQRPDAILKKFRKEFHRDPKEISLCIQDPREVGYDYGFTGVETAFLEKFKALKELFLPDSITSIEMTPALEKILKENRTLIRGKFGSFAESFAREQDLPFRPSDFAFAVLETTAPPETTRLTLSFLRNGKVEIKEEVTSPGTNAGNTFGGTFTHPLKKRFFETVTAEQIASGFRPALSDEILTDGRLEAFLKTAASHPYYTGKN